MASDIDDNIIIETSGLTAAVATDVVQFSGATAHFQIFKLAYGICGTANIVTSNDPLPVSFSSGLTATVSSLVTVQGTAGGYPLPVSGTIIATGSTASPVFIRTFTGSQVEVTGGRLYTQQTQSLFMDQVVPHLCQSNWLEAPAGTLEQ